jgi:hypothetical protein
MRTCESEKRDQEKISVSSSLIGIAAAAQIKNENSHLKVSLTPAKDEA